ncbi:MAG: TRAP transporter substrate-binding protein [Rhodospirillales bacterium]|nr:TRAP transporter substrate-binding protein [Rhodospirillales bacterium]
MKHTGIAKILAFGLAGAALVGFQASAKTVWDMSLAWPAGNFHVSNAEMFADKVKEVTGGEVEIVVHPGGELGIKGPEGMVAVRDGIVQMADILMNQQVGEDKYFGIESLPYLASGYDELEVLHKYFRPGIDKLAEKYNQKILFVVPWPGQAVYSKHEINVIDDLKGFKLRVVDKNGHNFFSRLGAAPLQLPWGEVVPSLASGVISGVTTSSSSGVDGKFWEFLGFMNRFNWQSSSNMINVNLDAWNDISPAHQAAIEKLGKEMQPVFWDISKKEDEKKIQALRDNGIKVSSPSAALKPELVKIAEKMWADFIASAGEPAASTIAAYRKDIGK